MKTTFHNGVQKGKGIVGCGHMTGQVLEGTVPKPQRGCPKHDDLSQSLDLAKLNPKGHMNYS